MIVVHRRELHGGVVRLILADEGSVRVQIQRAGRVLRSVAFRGRDLGALAYGATLARGGRFRGRARVLERRDGPALVGVFATRHGPTDDPALRLEVTRGGRLAGVPVVLVGEELKALERAIELARAKDTPKEIAS